MGKPHLNELFRNKCHNKDGIETVPMTECHDKTIVVDASIYVYRYEQDDRLKENVYNQLSIFNKNNIKPIYVFDGKPPKSKQHILAKRRELKKYYRQKQSNLSEQLLVETNVDERNRINREISKCGKKSVYMSKERNDMVKRIIIMFGGSYVDAPGEAEILCTQMVISGQAWSCMTEDMDVFLYGCPRVLRYFSIINKNAILYTTETIMKNIGITFDDFRKIFIITGTDYNDPYDGTLTLEESINCIKQYKKINVEMTFYEWMYGSSKYKEILEIDDNLNLKLPQNVPQCPETVCGKFDKTEIKKFMSEEAGFIFASAHAG